MANKPNFLTPAPKPAGARPGNAGFFSPTTQKKDTGLKQAALADLNARLVLGKV